MDWLYPSGTDCCDCIPVGWIGCIPLGQTAVTVSLWDGFPDSMSSLGAQAHPSLVSQAWYCFAWWSHNRKSCKAQVVGNRDLGHEWCFLEQSPFPNVDLSLLGHGISEMERLVSQ